MKNIFNNLKPILLNKIKTFAVNTIKRFFTYPKFHKLEFKYILIVGGLILKVLYKYIPNIIETVNKLSPVSQTNTIYYVKDPSNKLIQLLYKLNIDPIQFVGMLPITSNMLSVILMSLTIIILYNLFKYIYN